ncbi:NAD(P)/FAD-dependent oxidoreductase [Myceligenerans sp. TRM 65318]|uniref:NAD(P)/FAD-dependent oxidoreductase n=2 Tax=Myceligenerans pegani TaxID=2776917 RepID=A0ABR9N246_9MICO|nr:NAD(P)/FAD-dependent oxidoreductase [Myceligenerans sp. TRM 65318]MBE3019998.1 NAD(P)/FAD-dependent oxidoreductase [Myceligenerans sp. TRM 65318]
MPGAWDVIVIGGGAAGLSSALMLGRARRRVLVVDAGSPRNRFAAHMHGVLGNEGTDPADLLARGRQEAAGYGVEIRGGTVERVDEGDRAVVVSLDDGTGLSARALVVATGMTDRLPDVPGLAERWGRTVLHCPYCHGWEVRDRRLGVLVTSPMDLHRAQLIRQWSDDVVVFADGAAALDPELETRLRARGIELVASPVAEVLGEGETITGVRTADGAVVAVDAIFSGGQPEPHDAFLAHLGLARSETPVGSFVAVDEQGRTSAPRIWAVGNVVNPAATVPMATGAGAMTGGAVNMALVTEDFDLAVAGQADAGGTTGPDGVPAAATGPDAAQEAAQETAQDTAR